MTRNKNDYFKNTNEFSLFLTHTHTSSYNDNVTRIVGIVNEIELRPIWPHQKRKIKIESGF